MAGKGGKTEGAGRKKGVPNKAKGRFIAALNNMLENKADKIEDWIDEVYKEDGAKEALDCLSKWIEYCHAKKQRTEMAQDEENPFTITIKYPDNK